MLLSVKVFGTTGDSTGDISFSHRLPGDQISWLRFLMHKFNGDSETSSEIFAVGVFIYTKSIDRIYHRGSYTHIRNIV